MRHLMLAAIAALPLLATGCTREPGDEQALVDRATLSVQEMMTSLGDTPRDMLRKSRGVMVCPRVFKAGYAKSVHHARTLIKGRHIRVGRQIVNVPSFNVRVESEKHIDFAMQSPYGGARAGRVKRKREKAAAGGDADDD